MAKKATKKQPKVEYRKTYDWYRDYGQKLTESGFQNFVSTSSKSFMNFSKLVKNISKRSAKVVINAVPTARVNTDDCKVSVSVNLSDIYYDRKGIVFIFTTYKDCDGCQYPVETETVYRSFGGSKWSNASVIEFIADKSTRMLEDAFNEMLFDSGRTTERGTYWGDEDED